MLLYAGLGWRHSYEIILYSVLALVWFWLAFGSCLVFGLVLTINGTKKKKRILSAILSVCLLSDLIDLHLFSFAK